MTPQKSGRSGQGFVLPYVLIVIAILAMAGSIAALRLQGTTQMLSSIQAASRTARMMDHAEQTAVFALLGANPVSGGYDLNPNSPIQSDFGMLTTTGRPMDPREAEAIPADVWLAYGGLRRVQTPDGTVVIALQDVSGLPSLNTPYKVNLAPIMGRAGLSAREFDQLRDRLADYIDLDDVRRPRGAERSDYTLRGMPAPSNSPLRSYAELANVLGWDEVMDRLDMAYVKDHTTLQTAVDYRPAFAKSLDAGAPRPITSASLLSSNFDPMLDGVLARDRRPSEHLRLTLWAQRQSGADAGLWDKRVVEISRQSAHITTPYRRLWVLEATVLEAQTEFNPGLLDEIKYVIDPASLRP